MIRGALAGMNAATQKIFAEVEAWLAAKRRGP